MGRPRSFTEEQVREAVAEASSYSDVLRRIGLRPAGGNHRMIRRYVDEVWRIPTDHFDRGYAARRSREPIPLAEVLVAGSRYSRGHLKQRLFEEGLKARRCELCGQGEEWRGRRMGLILDHVNGVWDDNRLENLRIACPNCNATFDTHCGRKNRAASPPRRCAHCQGWFKPPRPGQRYCSRACGSRHDRAGRPRPSTRKVPRPPLDEVRRHVSEHGYRAAGRRYGVSDNAVRKWLRVASTA
jgi:hypothetical protein